MAKQAQIDAVRPVLTAVDKDVTVVEKAIDSAVSKADKATAVIESGLETVADAVPEALDKSVHVAGEATKHVVRRFRNPKTLVIVGAVGCVAAGVGVGFLVHKYLKHRTLTKITAQYEKELDDMREFYIRHYKKEGYSSPQEAAETLQVQEAVEAIGKYQGTTEEEATPAQRPSETPTRPAGKVDYTKVVRDSDAAQEVREHVTTISQSDGPPSTSNVFVDSRPLVPDDWDQEAEESLRGEDEPYIISFAEYMENAFEHEQLPFTWYDGDEILANEKDEMVHDTDSVVGDTNLGRFGDGSGDPNVVYVRNMRLNLDFEVTRSTGEYSKEVMGLRHSDRPTLRRARWGDRE